MNLVIDLGNTFAKIAVFQNHQLLESFKILKSEKNKKIEKIFEEYPKIEFSILSSVLKDNNSVEKILQKHSVLYCLDNQISLPYKNKYSSPETLGKDRIALAAAAVYTYPRQNCLVIDLSF